jgi:phage regulator Rha-like protein
MKDLVKVRKNEPTTDTMIVAEACGLDHKNVISLVREYVEKFQQLGSLAFQTRVIRSDGRGGQKGDVAILHEDHATFLITLFRNNDVVLDFKLDLVKEFRRVKDELSGRKLRSDLVLSKRAAHNPMMDALIEARADLGKETNKNHFMNENKLCNKCVIGKYKAINEADLTSEGLELLKRVRRHNESLLSLGMSYDDRKGLLLSFAEKQRLKLLGNMLKPEILLSSDVSDVSDV